MKTYKTIVYANVVFREKRTKHVLSMDRDRHTDRNTVGN